MPRFHFNLYNGIGFIPDKEGRELADIETARREAIKGARSIISQDALKGVIDLRGRMEVFDDAGRMVLRLPFSGAVELHT